MEKGNMDSGHPNIFTNRYADTKRPFQGFWSMLSVWQGSIFKLIWSHVLIFMLAFSGISLFYRNVLIYNEEHRRIFELVCLYCSSFSDKIPVSFTTAFYVANVVSRYWDQFISLPWPDRLAFKLVSFVPGQDTYSRTLRRTVMRYVNLSTVLVFRLVSTKVRDRFPTYASLVDAGLMIPGEDLRLADIDSKTTHETTWVPALWAISLLQQERSSGRMKIEATVFSNLINSFDYLEITNRKILNHGWVNFPFAYTQIITLSVYTYLYSHLFGRQFLEPKDGIILKPEDQFVLLTFITYIPVFTVIEFIAYLGWIKVAETLLNPWGDDDEDFQVNYVIDRNFQASLLIVDEAISEVTPRPDIYMAKPVPSKLPYYNTKQARCLCRRKRMWSNEIVIRMRGNFDLTKNPEKKQQQVGNQSDSTQPTSSEIQGLNC